jgi:hypothetical protein
VVEFRIVIGIPSFFSRDAPLTGESLIFVRQCQ